MPSSMQPPSRVRLASPGSTPSTLCDDPLHDLGRRPAGPRDAPRPGDKVGAWKLGVGWAGACVDCGERIERAALRWTTQSGRGTVRLHPVCFTRRQLRTP